MEYRPEIDGLRALAIMPIIIFHAGIDVFPGGFLGVDVFFVISGYLITTILLKDISNRNSILSFFMRRAKRILPVLIVVLIVCSFASVLTMLPEEYVSFSKSLIAVGVFCSNIFFWRETNYFDEIAHSKPLIHTWSLGVEEQFYLVFPFVLIFLLKFQNKHRIYILIFLSCISLLLSEWANSNAPVAGFYLTPTRAWELLFGVMVALIIHEKKPKPNEILSLFGLFLMIFSMVYFDRDSAMPGLLTIVPVLGVVLLILFTSETSWIGKFLSQRIFVFTGLISYSLYLWHQPIFVFSNLVRGDDLSLAHNLFLIFILFIVSYLSFRFIEQPARKMVVSPRQFLTFAISLQSVILSIGVVAILSQDIFRNFWLSKQDVATQKTYALLTTTTADLDNFRNENLGPCVFNVNILDPETEGKIIKCGKLHGDGIMVLGDSHAIDLFGLISSRFPSSFMIGVTKGGCRPNILEPKCSYEATFDFINRNRGIFKLVIYEQSGLSFLKEKSGKKVTGPLLAGLTSDDHKKIVVDSQKVKITFDYLHKLSDLVKVKWFFPRIEHHISKRTILKKGCDFKFKISKAHREVFKLLDNTIADILYAGSSQNLIGISQNDALQFDFSSDLVSCENIYWSDGDHYSENGEIRFSQRLPGDFVN